MGVPYAVSEGDLGGPLGAHNEPMATPSVLRLVVHTSRPTKEGIALICRVVSHVCERSRDELSVRLACFLHRKNADVVGLHQLHNGSELEPCCGMSIH